MSHSNLSAISILLRQVKSPFIYLLFGASGLSFFLGQLTDAFFILVFVLINTVLGFYQEYKSEQTVRLLKKFVSAKVTVIRDGQEKQVESSKLVPGDILKIEPGDIAQADIRIVSNKNLLIDESILTGESDPKAKTEAKLKKKTKRIFKADNIVFAGTTVISGDATGVVIATGKDKNISTITKLATETQRESSFEKSITSLSSFILKMTVITLIGMVIANIALKGSLVDLPNFLLFTVALAVSVIPEALPVVTTFSLSRGALRLSRQKVVVKRLSSIEELGGVTVLCTDKTGTITENKMKLVDSFALDKKNLMKFAAYSCDKASAANPYDMAIESMLDTELKSRSKNYKLIDTIPFDPEHRMSTVLVSNGGKSYIISRGAPENIAKVCSKAPSNVESWSIKQGEQGRRILAVAYREVDIKTKSLDKALPKLKFAGVLAFDDPLKATAASSIKRARELGVEIKILTGDRKDVAVSIGQKVGLIKSEAEVITGDVFENMNSLQRHKAIFSYKIFARVTPKQKYEIIKLLQEHNEVAFVGEGINDAPALKIANVGIAVSDASDVARESSDIILLNKSLHTIINGIAEGRSVFSNTIKYIKATLASNFGNFYAVAISSLLIPYLPMLPLQILLVNLLSDFPMVSIATDNVDDEEIKIPRSYGVREIALTSVVLGLVSSVFDFLTFAVFSQMGPQILQTNWFIESILTELLLIYSIRNRGFFLRYVKKSPPSLTILILTGLAATATVILPFSGFGIEFFEFVKPTFNQFSIVMAITLIYFATTEAAKLMVHRNLKTN